MTLEEKLKAKQMYAEILIEKNTALSGRTLVKQVGMVLFIEDALTICQEAIDEDNESQDQRLDKIIEFAFREGENWGVTYSTWFTPDRNKQKAKLKSVILATREKFNLPLPEFKKNT